MTALYRVNSQNEYRLQKQASHLKFVQISDLVRSGHLEQALAECQLLRKEEKNLFLLNSIGSIELRLGDPTAAIKSFQTAIKIKPKSGELGLILETPLSNFQI